MTKILSQKKTEIFKNGPIYKNVKFYLRNLNLSNIIFLNVREQILITLKISGPSNKQTLPCPFKKLHNEKHIKPNFRKNLKAKHDR